MLGCSSRIFVCILSHVLLGIGGFLVMPKHCNSKPPTKPLRRKLRIQAFVEMNFLFTLEKSYSE